MLNRYNIVSEGDLRNALERTADYLAKQTNAKGGSDPLAGLIFDASGNLYGTTSLGGARNYGTVFEMAP